MAKNAYELLSDQIVQQAALTGRGATYNAAGTRSSVSHQASSSVTYRANDNTTLKELAFDTVDEFDDDRLVFGGDP